MEQLARELFANSAVWGVVIPAGFLLLLFTVSILERRLTRPYIPARTGGALPNSAPTAMAHATPGARHAPQPPPPFLQYADDTPDPTDLPEYVRIMSDDALAAGFVFDRAMAHAKAPRIKILATVWFSPERDVVLLTGAGTVWNMPAFQTWLFTPLNDGRLLVTTDNNDEGDRSGIYLTKRVIRTRLPNLCAAHRKRLEKFGGRTGRFDHASAADALLDIYARRVDRMVARGVARYIDPGQVYWRYTAWGALRNCLGFFTQLAQTLPQAFRVNRSPIGSHETYPLGQSVYARYSRDAAPVAADPDETT